MRASVLIVPMSPARRYSTVASASPCPVISLDFTSMTTLWAAGSWSVISTVPLTVIAIIPTVISTELNVDYRVASFYGGTGLLIVISVALDLVQKINSHLVMRNYQGLTED